MSGVDAVSSSPLQSLACNPDRILGIECRSGLAESSQIAVDEGSSCYRELIAFAIECCAEVPRDYPWHGYTDMSERPPGPIAPIRWLTLDPSRGSVYRGSILSD